MSLWNLPTFRTGAPFPKPEGFGKWKLADSSLRRLSASLKVDAQPFSDPHEPVRAIPDPWAQARTFAEALVSGDPNHPLHNDALRQWRGLLALLALRELYPKDYTLTPERFALDQDGLFDRVLSHLTPQIALSGKVELWNQPLLIKLNKIPVAMGNPACLVSPGRLTPDLAFDKIPWYRQGLQDPTKIGLPVTQLFVLASWLRQLRSDIGHHTGEVADRLRLLLLQYANECDALCGSLPLSANLGPTLYNDLGDPYSRLFATARLNDIGDPSSTSRTKLTLDPAIDLGRLKGAILIDRALEHDDRFKPEQTLVWGTKTLSELLNSEQLFNDTAKHAAEHGWMLVTGDDLYTPRVAKFENGARIAGNPQGMEDLLVPLRPFTMLFPGDLRKRITARSGGGKALFTLTLPIDDGSEHGQTFDFTRHFSPEPGPSEGLLVDDEEWNIYHTALWPDFSSAAWRSYFVRFNYPEQKAGYMVRPAHALSASLVAAEVKEQETSFAAIERLREINSGKPLRTKADRWIRSERKSAGEYEDIQHATVPFEAISYIDAFGERRDAPAGLALIDLKPIEGVGGPFDVAVDFGTTNTVACFDDGTPIGFKDRLVYPLAYSNPEMSSEALHSARWLVRRFFPPELRQTPTPTVALNRVPFPSQEGHHVFRNVVYFHSHERHATNAEIEELNKFKRVASQAKFNLKWSDDAEHAEASRDFLNQFVLMVAAEALAAGRDPGRMRWRFSVPDSLDGEMRLHFEDNLREITATISTKLPPGEMLQDLYSEGLAAAEFILDGKAGFTRGSLNLVLDIGGGTTDVTIWDLGPIHWMGSFRLAGQNFFTRTISQNPEILTPIGLGHWQALFEAREGSADGVSQQDIPHLAEMLFSGPALQEAIDTHWNSRLKLDIGRNLRLIAQTFIAGIAWYMGRIVGQMVADGRLRPDQLETTAFALCGRGAGLFKKMHAGRDADQESEVTRALQVFLVAAGAEAATRPQLFTTPDAKLEVVRGMVFSRGQYGAMVEDADRFHLAGLDIAFEHGDPLTTGQKVDRANLSSKSRSVDLGELKAFLAALKSKAKISIDLQDGRPQGAAKAIELAVLKSLEELRTSKDVNRELEPPFITALRALIDTMAAPAAERDRRLTMEFVK